MTAVGLTSAVPTAKRSLTISVVRDQRVDEVDSFHYGALEGVVDFASWLESYAPTVEAVAVQTGLTAAHAISPLPDSDELEHVRNELPNEWQAPGKATLVLTATPDLHLGRSNGQLYDDVGTVCHVNANHTGMSRLTGPPFGYNIAIHELAHGQTRLGGPGGKHDHALGDPRVTSTPEGTLVAPTIFATGYAHVAQQSAATPATDCTGAQWEQHYRSSPRPEFTACTCRELLTYHAGDRDAVSADDFQQYTNVSRLESPTR